MQKSFILHLDSLGVLNKMTDEQAGKLIKLIFQYKTTGTLPDDLDFGMSMAIDPFVNQFKRDEEKYLSTVERNRANGSKGGRPKGSEEETQTIPNNPVGFSETQINPTEPKKPYSDSDTDSVSDNDTDNDSVTESETLFLLEKETKVYKFDFFKKMTELGFEKKYVDEFKVIRKTKKAVNSELALTKLLNEIDKSGLDKNDCLKIICEKQWKGFEADWLKNNLEKEKSSAQKEKESEAKIGRQTVAELEGNYQMILNAIDGVQRK